MYNVVASSESLHCLGTHKLVGMYLIRTEQCYLGVVLLSLRHRRRTTFRCCVYVCIMCDREKCTSCIKYNYINTICKINCIYIYIFLYNAWVHCVDEFKKEKSLIDNVLLYFNYVFEIRVIKIVKYMSRIRKLSGENNLLNNIVHKRWKNP